MPDMTVAARWDAERGTWRHWLCERNSETGLFETVCETDEEGLALEEDK